MSWDLQSLTAILSMGAIAFSCLKYVWIRAEEIHQDRYKNYHELIEKISKGAGYDGSMKLVSQISYIFELQFYREYRKNSINILNSLMNDWNQKENNSKSKDLGQAIVETKDILSKNMLQFLFFKLFQ